MSRSTTGETSSLSRPIGTLSLGLCFAALLVACQPESKTHVGLDGGLGDDDGEAPRDAGRHEDAGPGPCAADDACAVGELCEAGHCEPRLCEPGALLCADGRSLKTCNTRGDGYDVTTCSAGRWCVEGECRFECPPDLSDCGGSCRDLASDRVNCGTCGVACAAGEVCSTGACVRSCETGLSDCGGSCRDLSTDRADCGACGVACGAGEVCSTGACVRSCETGLTACGGSCRDLVSDRANCGSCGVICGAGDVCSTGACIRSCEVGLTECTGSCRDLVSDRANCGTCGVTCAAGEVCSTGACVRSCEVGLTECTGSCVDVTTSESHCGACGAVCPEVTGAVPACAMSRCGYLCAVDLGDCDGLESNGCETDLTSSPTRCGACGVTCPATPNATPSCTSGACGFSCTAGFANCDGVVGNGCEADLSSNASNCGSCDNACGSAMLCDHGACVRPCPSGTTFTSASAVGQGEAMVSHVQDVDHDGYQDILWVNQLSNNVEIWWGGATGYRAASQSVATGRSEGYVDSGDLNGDGFIDLIASNQDYARLVIVWGTGPRTFGASTNVPQGGFPQWTRLIDADRDGDLDVIVAARDLSCTVVRLNDGRGNLAAGACFVSRRNWMRPADIDGDGFEEFVESATGTVFSTATRTLAASTTLAFPGTSPVTTIYPVDVDGDRDIDFVLPLTTGTTTVLRTYLNDGVGNVVACGVTATIERAPSADIGDVNADGRWDYTSQTTCSFCSSTYYVYLQNPG